MGKRVKKIVFFASIPEVDAYFARLGKESAQCDLFIALTPRVRVYARMKGLDARDTTNYFTNDSHVHALQKSTEGIAWFRHNLQFSDLGLDITSSYSDVFAYWMRAAMHYCLWIIEIVTNAIALHSPEVIAASLSSSTPVFSLYVEPEERYLGRLVKMIADAANLRFEDISTCQRAPLMRPMKISGRLKATADFAIRYEKFKIWQSLLWLRNCIMRQPTIIFTSPRYRMDALMTELKKDFPDTLIYWMRTPVLPVRDLANMILRLFRGKHAEDIIGQKRAF